MLENTKEILRAEINEIEENSRENYWNWKINRIDKLNQADQEKKREERRQNLPVLEIKKGTSPQVLYTLRGYKGYYEQYLTTEMKGINSLKYINYQRINIQIAHYLLKNWICS